MHATPNEPQSKQSTPMQPTSTQRTPTLPTPTLPTTIARWHELVAANDLSHIEELLADDAEFASPAVFKPQIGKALVAKYLRAAMAVLNNPTFCYTDQWLSERSAVLEFEATIDDVFVNGVDVIRWNEQDLIVAFKVMVRPWKGLNTVIALMGKQLQADSV